MCQRQREKSWVEKKWKIFENYDVGKDNSAMLLTNTNYEKPQNKNKIVPMETTRTQLISCQIFK